MGDNEDPTAISQNRCGTDDPLSSIEYRIPYLEDRTVMATDKSLIGSLLRLNFPGLWAQPYYGFFSNKVPV